MYNNCQHLNINIVPKDSILYYYLFTYITRFVARGVTKWASFTKVIIPQQTVSILNIIKHFLC